MQDMTSEPGIYSLSCFHKHDKEYNDKDYDKLYIATVS